MKPVIERIVSTEKPYPLIFEARAENFDYASWIQENKVYIEDRLFEYGSLYFSNLGLNGVDKFEQFVELLCRDIYHGYGDLPQRSDSPKLYGATPYPAPSIIHFHNEASHTAQWPLKQLFYCVKAAEEGGELRIADGRAVLKALSSDLVHIFAEKGLMYIRNFVPYFDVSWQEFYKTTDRDMLEELLTNSAIDYEWRGSTLQTRQYAPAVEKHPRTNDYLWFNQIQLHHPRMLDRDVFNGIKTALGSEDNFPRYVCFGDGTPIPDTMVEEISSVLNREAVNLKAKQGDVIFNDNMLVAHSRLPYKGDREVCVALAEPMQNKQSHTPDSLNRPRVTGNLAPTSQKR